MNKKEEIIRSALYLFSRHGFSETSIDKIAKQAGVSKGLTYTHFKNKDDLLKAVIEYTIIAMTADMMEIKEMEIKSLLLSFFESLQKNTDIIRLCLLLVIHPETPAEVNGILEKQKQELLALLSQLLSNQFGADSPREAAILLATLDGLTIDYVTQPDAENLLATQNYLINKYR